MCFLTRSGSSFSCENVQSENLTWQQFLNDLPLAVKSTSALQEQFLQSSLVEEQKGFYYYYYFSSRGNFIQTVCYVFSQHSRSNQQFWSHCSPLTLYYPKKINPFPALPADSPRQQRGRTEAQANNVTFLPLQPHTVKTRLGNVIM